MKAPFHYEAPPELEKAMQEMKQQEHEVREELKRIIGDRFMQCGYTENKDSEQ